MKKMKSLFRVLLGLVVLSLLLSPLGVLPVKAQSGTQLVIVPATTTASTCGETILRVRVESVNDLNSYEIGINFSPASAVRVLGVKNIDTNNGGFLIPGQTWWTEIDNDNGYLNIQYSQLGATSGKTGSGDLVEIRLRALQPGVAVNFTFNQTTTGLLPFNSNVYMPYTSTGATVTTVEFTGTCSNISLYPDQANVCKYDGVKYFDQIMYVMVSDVVDLVSYDGQINFTPGPIQIRKVENAGFLTGNNFPLFSYDNTLGTITMSFTLLSPWIPRSGSGQLVKITYRVLQENKVVNFSFDEGLTNLVNDDGFGIAKMVTDGGVINTLSCPTPNAVDLKSFDVLRKSKKAILSWETASEIDIQGFNIYRSGKKDGTLKKINAEIIPADAVGSSSGATYQIINSPLKPWKTYFYWLEWVDMDSNPTLYGPIKAKPPK